MIMRQERSRHLFAAGVFLFAGLLGLSEASAARPKKASPPPRVAPAAPAPQDDSLVLHAPKDLELQSRGSRKAEALLHFVEAQRLEESGEIDEALEAYQKVLTVDPGQVELALHVAALLIRQEEFPRAIDVLKDAQKENPKAPPVYLQLAQVYSKYLRKHDQALRYANEALALDPTNIEAYQRIYEIHLAAGQPQRGLEALERAALIKNDAPQFWLRLGKLFAGVLLRGEEQAAPEQLQKINTIFRKAAELARNEPAVLKDVADYFAGSRQLPEAIPLYLRVLELQPDDANAREKLATGFVLTNQRPQAIAMLEEIIRTHPEKSQAYELLGGVYEDEARALDRANQTEEARAMFRKAAQNYEQTLLINPGRPAIYLRLAELLLARVRDNARAVDVLRDARRRFPGAPELTYYLAIGLREAKRSQEAVTTFEEALREAETAGASIATARFYFDYGTAAEQAAFYDKAADLFRTAIALDPANAAESCNSLGYMLAEQNMHLEEAEEMVRRALDFDPDNGAYLDSMGWVRYRQGKFQEALDFLLKAAEHLPKDDATVFDHVGDAYAKLNNPAKALEFWQRAVLLEPENKAIAAKVEGTRTKVSQGPTAAPTSRR